MNIPSSSTLALLLLTASLAAQTTPEPAPETIAPIPPPPRKPGVLTVEEIADFQKNSPAVQHLISSALTLASRQLEYKMGSDDPEKGGMDCSGTIYYLLRSEGFTATPRQSDQQYRWVWEADTFTAVNGVGEKTFELSRLRPGFLLFWTGTYDTGERNPPVSHVMLYLGRKASDGSPIMFGGSDGRTYEGKSSWGIGVFDFRMPSSKSTSRFIGYAKIPGLNYNYTFTNEASSAP